MHRCLEAGNAGKEKVGVFVPHELNSLQLRRKKMPLGWLKGQRLLSHCPQTIRNRVTLVQTILKLSTSSRFGNVPSYPSVVCDKGLAEMSKEVCVVNAADYSYFRSVRADSVTQTLICYKNLKTSLPSDVYIGRAFHGEFRYSTPRNIGKLCPKPSPALTPRVHMGPIVEAAVPRRSAELPPPSPSKNVPNDLSLRSMFAVSSPRSLVVNSSRSFAIVF